MSFKLYKINTEREYITAILKFLQVRNLCTYWFSKVQAIKIIPSNTKVHYVLPLLIWLPLLNTTYMLQNSKF